MLSVGVKTESYDTISGTKNVDAAIRSSQGLERIGGDDGTRTRGLCRDRVDGRRSLLELNGTDSPFLVL
jgi:hypothetical protein